MFEKWQKEVEIEVAEFGLPRIDKLPGSSDVDIKVNRFREEVIFPARLAILQAE